MRNSTRALKIDVKHKKNPVFHIRVKPHPVMRSEYPAPYYKFRNEQVAKAFWMDSMGVEQKDIPKRKLFT